MQWWMVTAVAVGGLLVSAPAVRRHLLRRRAVARVRTELAWFYQQRAPRDRYTPGSGKHASTTPVVVLRRSDGSALGWVSRHVRRR
ncbi:hypothetical protein MOQ72_31270 [Saccharopolyspora sp. K220]|uniref:hypothetical protein n=1 Tax=Saccharopolyspora soli TaxID=2926618 RepID=UPI001F566C2C|nr:hypothetical protein [Saccharopolyspora soli]MCI2421925.1 hypothetical protein [Saccharopolyspora soli]